MHMNEFAQSWIDDWNSHDLEKILSHYADELEFHSPKVAIATNGEKEYFTSKAELRPYFARAFVLRPNLKFELMHICKDEKAIALIYKGENGTIANEIMECDENGKAVFVRVLYDKL